MKASATYPVKGVTISANHIEAHIDKQWVEGVGDSTHPIGMVIPKSEQKPNEDKALKAGPGWTSDDIDPDDLAGWAQ